MPGNMTLIIPLKKKVGLKLGSLQIKGMNNKLLINYVTILMICVVIFLEKSDTAPINIKVIGYQKESNTSNILSGTTYDQIMVAPRIIQAPDQIFKGIEERLCQSGYKIDNLGRCRLVWK
ncbi:uncharacterized protein LOC142321887 [Lycorma delicatula]|uniref:uncharacterized protein LOC142321887 n=1 Tax=Lycorma delicatula TaxID=130591 RepID=UPI003F51243E